MTGVAFKFALAAILIALFVALSVTASNPPRAAAVEATLGIDHNGGAPDINAGPASAPPFGEATVSLIVEAPPAGVAAWTVDIHYDPAALTPTACEPFPVFPALALCNPAFSPTALRVVGSYVPGVHGTFNLADITFQVLPPAGECSAITLEVVTLADPLLNLLSSEEIEGEVCSEVRLGIDHDGGAPDINAGPASAPPFGEATVSLIVEAPPAGVAAWTVDIHYDPAALTPTACEPFPVFPALALCNPAFSPTALRVVGSYVPGVSGTFNLADITFQLLPPAGACSTIKLEVVTLADPMSNLLSSEVFNGEICASHSRVPTESDFVGDWEAIHPDPEIPNAELSIRGRQRFLQMKMTDDLSGFCTPDGPALALGSGAVSPGGDLVVNMRFRCPDRVRSVVPFNFQLALFSPDEMVDQTGLVWHRVGG